MKKFFCSVCGSEILSGFSEAGDTIQCNSCFAGVVVPENAIDVIEEKSSPDGFDVIKSYVAILFSNIAAMMIVGFIFGVINSVYQKNLLQYLNPFSFIFNMFFIISFVYYFTVKKYNISIKDFFNIKSTSFKEFLMFGTLAVGFGFLGIYLERIFLVPGTAIESIVKNSFQFTLRGKVFSYSYFHVIALIAPFYEEIFYRGFMYKAIKKNKGKLFSVLMVTFLFVLDHAGQLFRSPVLLGYIGLIGIILILIRIFNKNLVNCIIFHFIYNLTVIVLANIALFRTLFLID